MMKSKGVFLLALMLVTYSCKKEIAPKEEPAYVSHLPNYSNVQLDKVFTAQDRALDNKALIVSQITNYYNQVWEKGNLSGGVLVAKADDILFEKYRGFGRVNNEMPINENTPLHVASVSKTMTAMALLKLVEAGKLKLEDDITKFFPKFPYPGITVLSLVSQRSGLPKYEYFDKSVVPAPAEL